MSCLYQLEFPSGKKYIGIAKETAESRFKVHIYRASAGSKAAVHCAIRKYGVSSVKITTLAVAEWGDYLKDLEKEAILSFETFSPKGYNLTSGGDGLVNPATSVRKRMSRSMKIYFSSNPLAKEKIGEESKSRWGDPEFRSYLLARRKLRHSDPKVRKKMSTSAKIRWKNETSEARRVIAENIKKRWSDPIFRNERRLRQSLALKAAWSDPEKRARILAGRAKSKSH